MLALTLKESNILEQGVAYIPLPKSKLSRLCVAVISTIMAKLIGIGPLWSLIPFIVAGSIPLILIWHFIGNRHWGHTYTAKIIALAAAAADKFDVLKSDCDSLRIRLTPEINCIRMGVTT